MLNASTEISIAVGMWVRAFWMMLRYFEFSITLVGVGVN